MLAKFIKDFFAFFTDWQQSYGLVQGYLMVGEPKLQDYWTEVCRIGESAIPYH